MHVQNAEQLATTPLRRDALAIVEAGLAAIDTERVIARHLSYDGRFLTVAGRSFDLSGVRRLHIIGFGKASCKAAQALERMLGSRIEAGIVIGNTPSTCEIITAYVGTHPLPSALNAEHTERMMLHCKDMHEDDMVIVIVSGGGSALLCWPMSECEQGRRLYEAALHADLTIHELNTVRKHLSQLKGGGLAKLLWPARVIGLIFSDIPGGQYDLVASGPTYFDSTNIADAQAIIERHALGDYTLIETPKDEKFFARIDNIVLVSNSDALEAMAAEARTRGYAANVVAAGLAEEPSAIVHRLLAVATPQLALIAGGEFRLRVPEHAGRGGRNMHATLAALDLLQPEDLFIAIASDGMDNTDAAGAIADAETRRHADLAGINPAEYLKRFDEYTFFSRLGDLVMTGPTEANVSDLMVFLRPGIE